MLKVAPKAFKWFLPIVLIASLLASMCYYLLTPSPAFASPDNDGEQSAQFLPDDTEFYLSINLDEIDLGGFIAGEGDLAAIWDNWADDLELRGLDAQYWLNKYAGEIPEWVDIGAFLSSYFGPELAVALRDVVPTDFEQPQPPDSVVLLGVKDKSASDALFDMVLPPGGTPGNYLGIETLVFEGDVDFYLAFPDDWVVFSHTVHGIDPALFYETLDLVLAGGGCLYDTAGFQSALENLPPDRVCMSYINVEDILTDALAAFGIIEPGASLPETIEIPVNEIVIFLHFFYLPDVIAAATSFTENGIISTTYYHYPEGMAPPAPGDDPLHSTKIVPADALLFTSGQNPNATWEYILLEVADGVDAGEDWAIALDEILGYINDMLAEGMTLNDIWGLMDQEVAYALLPIEPFTFDEEEALMPSQLMMIELEDDDIANAEGMMADLLDALNLEAEEGCTVDSRTAYRPTEASWNEFLGDMGDFLEGLIGEEVDLSGMPRLGYFFLEDVDGTNFLVIGFPVEDELNALEAALDAKNGTIPSLDEASDFNTILNMLGVSPPYTGLASLSYVTINGILSNIVSLMGEDMPMEVTNPTYFMAYFMSPLRALGSSTTYITESVGMLTSTAIYIHMVEPLVPLSSLPWGQWTEWKSGAWTASGGADLTLLDPDIGYVSVEIAGSNSEAGGVGVTVYKEPSSEEWDGFALAASDEGLGLSDIAYVVDVDAPASAGEAIITMKVNRAWADNYGVDNVVIFRYYDGTCQMLDTTFEGYEGDLAVFQATSPDGLSTFGLGSTYTPAPAGGGGIAWIAGPIVGGIVIAALGIWLFRRRAKAEI